jgi:hypothetical protein
MDKEELYIKIINDQKVKFIMLESFNTIKNIDKVIENDLQEPYCSYIPVSANLYIFIKLSACFIN